MVQVDEKDREGERRARERIYFVIWVSTTKEGVFRGPVLREDREEEAELDILSLGDAYCIRPGLMNNEHCCRTMQVVMVIRLITKDDRIQDRGAVRVCDTGKVREVPYLAKGGWHTHEMGIFQVFGFKSCPSAFIYELLYAELTTPLDIIIDFGAVVASVSGTDLFVVLVAGEGPVVVPSAPIPLSLA